MIVKNAAEIDGIMQKVAVIFVDCFYDIALKHVSKDKEKLTQIFTKILIPEHFYVALIGNDIAGIIACVKKGFYSINYDKSHELFTQHFGKIKGIFLKFLFKNVFTNYAKYPLEIDNETAVIEFVATDKNYRKMGVATSIMNHLFTFFECKYFVLEVVDDNTNAIELYNKMGFKEIVRKEPSHRKISGINYFVYMKYSKEE